MKSVKPLVLGILIMKLNKILENINLPKDKWIGLSNKEVIQLKNDIYDLVSNAYKPIGGHPNLKSPSDVVGKLGDLFTAIDLDSDPNIDAVAVGKKKPAGTKYVALGHDGSKKAKSAAVGHNVSNLKKQGFYIEVSGKMFDILKAKGVPIVDDEEVVRKVLKGKKIDWNGDGTYSRLIGGKLHTKILMGKPNI